MIRQEKLHKKVSKFFLTQTFFLKYQIFKNVTDNSAIIQMYEWKL